jgi:P-loop containing dynein motor region
MLTKYVYYYFQLHQSYSLSLQTKASDIRSVIRGTMQNRTRNILEPLGNKKLVIFLDDLNMPLVRIFKKVLATKFNVHYSG